MGKDYRDYPVESFGHSEMATLSVIFFNKDKNDLDCYFLHIGSDGSYRGRVVYDDVEIPGHYRKVKTIHASWISVYDDEELVFHTHQKALYEFYLAGEFTVLINIKSLGEGW